MTRDEALGLLLDAPTGDYWSEINPKLTQAQVVDIVYRGIDALKTEILPELLEKRVRQVCDQPRRCEERRKPMKEITMAWRIFLQPNGEDMMTKTTVPAIPEMPTIHDICIFAAAKMIEDGMFRHISYITKDDGVAIATPGKVIKVTVEYADESETIDEVKR